MVETINWLAVTFDSAFLWIGVMLGYLIGHIRGSQWGLDHVQTLVRGRSEDGKKTVYVRPSNLTQQEQAAWVHAIQEVDRDATHRQMLGLETFCCVECEKEPTYELLCSLCIADERLFGHK